MPRASFFSSVFGVIAALIFAGPAAADYSVEYYPDNAHRTLAPGGAAPANYNLDSLPLVLTSAATVDLGGTLYNFSEEGLYRIYDGSKLVRQAFRYAGDPWRFAGHLSRVHVHGWRHNDRTVAQLDTLARDGETLSITCGNIVQYVCARLEGLSVPTRSVHLSTLDEWNKYDNGHYLLEIRDPVENRWILYDATLGSALRYNGHRLNVLDAVVLYRSGKEAEIEFISTDSVFDPQSDYHAHYGTLGASDASVKTFINVFNHDQQKTQVWYKRMFQVPSIGSTLAVWSEAEAARARQYGGGANQSCATLSPEEYRRQFYPGEPVYVP